MTTYRRLTKKMANELLSVIRKEAKKNGSTPRKFIIAHLMDSADGMFSDGEGYEFAMDVLLDGYKHKGYNQMNLTELTIELIETNTGIITLDNYAENFHEVKGYITDRDDDEN